MCYEIKINVDHNGHSFQLRQKNFTVEWFSMLGHQLIEQLSYARNMCYQEYNNLFLNFPLQTGLNITNGLFSVTPDFILSGLCAF